MPILRKLLGRPARLAIPRVLILAMRFRPRLPPLASDIFFFDADVASGLDWLDTDGTTDLTAATAGDMARYDGTDWIKVVNLRVAAGGSTARVVLADAVGVSNTAGPHEITLTEAMMPRQLLSFFVFSSAAASPDGIGYLLSDDLLALTAEATTPTDAENALPVVTASYSASNFTQQSGNYFVFRKDDSTLWVRPTRLVAHTLTITATPLGGGLSTSEQQELVSEARLIDTFIITSTNALTTTATTTPMDSVPRDTFNFTTIPIEDFERIDLGLELDGTYDFVVPIRISRQMMLDIPATPADLYPDGGTTTRRLQAVYWSGRVSAGINSEIGTAVTRPRFDWVDARRGNGIESLSIAFTKNTDGDISQMHTYASSDVVMRLVYAVIRHYEE